MRCCRTQTRESRPLSPANRHEPLVGRSLAVGAARAAQEDRRDSVSHGGETRLDGAVKEAERILRHPQVRGRQKPEDQP